MSELKTFEPVGSRNNVNFKQRGKDVFHKVGKYGLAAGIVGIVCAAPSAYVEPVIDSTIMASNFTVGSGLPNEQSENKSIGNEKEHNQFSLILVTPRNEEYDNRSHTFQLLLNGATIGGNYPMIQNEGLSEDKETLVMGKLNFIGDIQRKARIDDFVDYSVKEKNLDYSEFTDIKGNLEFIGQIPKKPRI